MNITDEFVFFWNGIYSNWYPATFILDGIQFSCAEQYMMYKKAELFNDDDIMEVILMSDSPNVHKALGRKVKNFDADIWNASCKDIVYTGCLAKFSQNNSLKEQLLVDGKSRKFVEASPYDRIWGIGMYEDDEGVECPDNWQGLNWLGEVLDRVYQTLETK